MTIGPSEGALVHFRAADPELRHGGFTQLFANKDRYMCVRSSPEQHALVVLNRAGVAQPIEVDVNDRPLPKECASLLFPARRRYPYRSGSS